MISNNYEILVNMPNCNNLKFYFENENIVKSKRICYKKSIDAILFYNLEEYIQIQINVFINPNAI